MSVLGSIFGKIFGRDDDDQRARTPTQTQTRPQTTPQAAPRPQTTPAPTGVAPTTGATGGHPSAAGAAPPASVAARQPVDVEKMLESMDAAKAGKSNWRTSIVDLMDLLGIDSSKENRIELARELGYGEDTSDSAKMNMWLHRKVMTKLAENGGVVPASMRD